MTDLEIIKKFQDGNLDLFSKLYDKYVDEIYKFVYLKTSNKEVAEDIVSESFMSAFENLDNFLVKEKSNFRAWIYKISYNKVINFYKTKDRTTDICDYIDLVFQDDFAKRVDDKDKLKEIENYIKSIKKRDRDILIHRIWCDLSYKEIAQIMWLSIDNCKKIVSRNLRKIWETHI